MHHHRRNNTFTRAIVRKPGPNFAEGLTTSTLGRPEFGLMQTQHEAYTRKLEALGLAVTVLPPEPAFPDAHFVEDAAVVTPDIAVITRPGAPARQGEERTIEPALVPYRPIARIVAPGTLDGGDVLMAGTHFFVGISERTNAEGAQQLGRILSRYGNTWTAVKVGRGLHLKSEVNLVGPDTLLLTATFATHDAFAAYQKIVLDPAETYAGNTLLINGNLIMPEGFPKTRERLEALGCPVHALDVSEVRKMDGGLTCLSLRF